MKGVAKDCHVILKTSALVSFCCNEGGEGVLPPRGRWCLPWIDMYSHTMILLKSKLYLLLSPLLFYTKKRLSLS